MVPGADREFFERRVIPFWTPLIRYHRYTLAGAEHLPKGRALILTTHAMATYELFLFLVAIYRATGRIVRPLGDRIWFRIQPLRDWCLRLGGVDSSPATARALLEQDEAVLLAPGGMWEAIRPSSERYEIRWGRRSGFAKLALETGAPVLLLVCPAADEIFHLYPNRLTDWIYRRYKFPLPLLRGLGPTIIPRPVRLDAFLSAPIEAPGSLRTDESATQTFRAQLLAAMERHLEESAKSRC